VSLAPIFELGRRLELEWSAADFDVAAFPELCSEHLEDAKLHTRLNPDDIVRAVFEGEVPLQLDPTGRFGQPPVTLFRGRRFYIDALFWVDGTTTIHDHAFSGAFQVLSGESIETNFTFTTSKTFGAQVQLGSLTVQGSALRRTGAVRMFSAGPNYIHSLFHLARPSLSLVVRSYRDFQPGIQFEYAPPGMAFDTLSDDPMRERVIQLVAMMRRTNHSGFEQVVGDLIAKSDVYTATGIILACLRHDDAGLVDRLAARVRDPAAGTQVINWLRWRRRTEFLLNRRSLVHEPELRFMLAVLLNAQRRTDAMALVASYAPEEDPAKKVATWLRQLSLTTMRLQIGGTPFEPNVLGLPGFGPGCEEALAEVLGGRGQPRDLELREFVRRVSLLPHLSALFAQ
jgi:hypothetical protein